MSRMMNSKKGKKDSGRGDSGRRSSGRRDFDKRDSDRPSFSRGRSDRRDSGSRDFERKDYDRPSFSRGNSERRDFKRRDFSDRRDGPQMTKVTCASCGEKCEVPFKPTSSKPVYCRDCFGKQDDDFDRSPKKRSSSGNISERDLDIINEKLNKIMKALDIR